MKKTIQELERVVVELERRKIYSAAAMVSEVLKTAKEEQKEMTEYSNLMLNLP